MSERLNVFAKTTHLQVATTSAENIKERVDSIHKMLGQLYLLASRPIDESQRQQMLNSIHELMYQTRQFQEVSDLMALSVKGVGGDIDSALLAMGKALKGVNYGNEVGRAAAFVTRDPVADPRDQGTGHD